MSPAPAAPGTHWIHPDADGIVWASENWAHNMVRIDPKTGNIKKIPWPTTRPLNSPMGGNYSMDKEGFIWDLRDRTVRKGDSRTGKLVQTWPTKRYEIDLRQRAQRRRPLLGRRHRAARRRRHSRHQDRRVVGTNYQPDSIPARGGFDPDDNYWSGGRGGPLVEFNIHNHTVKEFVPPTAYGRMYTAAADKNGEVWAGDLQAGRYLRFNPKTEQFIEYVLPEPYAHDRKSSVDNSTDPVSVWYVDHEGYIVHIQPLE